MLVAVDGALAQVKPRICNSDQGSHFTNPHYTQRLKNADILISMDGKGRALDNIFTERFWRSLKYEEVYLREIVYRLQGQYSGIWYFVNDATEPAVKSAIGEHSQAFRVYRISDVLKEET